MVLEKPQEERKREIQQLPGGTGPDGRSHGGQVTLGKLPTKPLFAEKLPHSLHSSIGSRRFLVGEFSCSFPSDAVSKILAEEKALGLDTFTYYESFGARVRSFREEARKLIGSLRHGGKRIAAYGAAAKGTIMLNYLNLNSRAIEYAVDKNVHKRGKYMPGVRIQIHDPARLMKDKPDYVVILPWNFRDEIVRQQHAFLEAGGRFIVPIPNLEVVEREPVPAHAG